MKITIYQNREVYKEESKIGNDSENKVETLEFEFPKEYEDFTKYIEFQIKGEKYVDLIEDNKYAITREVAKYGKIKTQVVLKKNTENDVMIFKSDVFTLTVSNSINATENLIYTVGVDLIEKIVTKNNEQDTRLDALEADNTTNKENILNLQNDNTTNKSDIKSLQDDNEVNKTDISNIKQEQTTQNTNISNLQTENTSLKNQIPSGEATGNPIHLSDSSDLECEIAVVGNSEQETREGYNKIKYPYVFVDSANTTIQDDSANNLIVENTTPGSNSYFFIDNINLEADKTYTISRIYEIMTGTKTDETAQIELYLAGTWKKVLLYQSSSLATFTVDTSGKYRIVIKNGNSSSALKVKYTNLMILEGTYTADTLPPYEQYGAMPSPDYPSPVETVGQNVNIFNILDYTATLKYTGEAQIFDSNNFRVIAKYSTDSNCMTMFRTIDLTNYAGKTLTIQAIVKSNTDTNKAFIVLRQNNYDYSGTKANELYDESQNTTDGVITLKYKVVDAINDNNRYLFMGFYATRGNNCNIGDYVDYKVKMVEGTEVGGYSPYGQGSVEISVDNGLETTDANYQSYTKVLPIQKEFVKIGDVEDTFIKVDGKWYEAHYHPKIVFDGTENILFNASDNVKLKVTLQLDNLKENTNQSSTIDVLSNSFKGVSANNATTNLPINSISVISNKRLFIILNISVFSNVETFKTWLAEKYANGAPIIAYPTLKEPELIECTQEQIDILNSFYTYKGITNVSMSGIGKIKIIYKQDQETINKNYENRLAALEAAIS